MVRKSILGVGIREVLVRKKGDGMVCRYRMLRSWALSWKRMRLFRWNFSDIFNSEVYPICYYGQGPKSILAVLGMQRLYPKLSMLPTALPPFHYRDRLLMASILVAHQFSYLLCSLLQSNDSAHIRHSDMVR